MWEGQRTREREKDKERREGERKRGFAYMPETEEVGSMCGRDRECGIEKENEG